MMKTPIILRCFAVLLSAIAPGYGHFLIGAFRRGVAWVIGFAVFELTMLSLSVLSFSRYRFRAVVIAALVGILVGHIAAAIDTARFAPSRHSWKMFVLAWVALLASSGLFDLLVYPYYVTHYVQAFRIPSSSMEPTLLVGDHLLSDNSFYRAQPPQRGDTVVFKYPLDPSIYFVMRVIWVSGDRIHLDGKRVYRNNVLLDEPFVVHQSIRPNDYRDNFPNSSPETNFPKWANQLPDHVRDGNVVVPAGNYFVMGDNRDFSSDSRYWGFVPNENIIGKPSVIYWSFETSTDFQPSTGEPIADLIFRFPQAARWNRLLRPIE